MREGERAKDREEERMSERVRERMSARKRETKIEIQEIERKQRRRKTGEIGRSREEKKRM